MIVAIGIPKGDVMPTNNEIVDIFKRRMPGLTPSEAQDIVDYLSQVDSAVSRFGGGNTLDIGTLNADFGNWGQFPYEGVFANLAEAQEISDATNEKIEFAQANYQYGSPFWTIAEPTKITIQSSGIYLLCATVTFEVNANNSREMRILINNATVVKSQGPGVGGTSTTKETCVTRGMGVGDVVELQVWQNSGVALDCSQNQLHVFRIR